MSIVSASAGILANGAIAQHARWDLGPFNSPEFIYSSSAAAFLPF